MKKVPVALLILLLGFPMIGETIYSPSLPALAHDFGVSGHLAEMTLSVFLAGFAIGVALWGLLADRFGRRPAMLGGLCVYTLGSIGCLLTTNIYLLLFMRLIQALGGSAGSVVSQTMIRDQFDGPSRSRLFSTISIALAMGPAIGTFIGGLLAPNYGWQGAFWFLAITGCMITAYCCGRLSETRAEDAPKRSLSDLCALLPNMLRDRHILRCAALIALSNGMMFSFYGEGPFVLIERMGMSEETYGVVGLAITGAGILSAMTSRRLVARLSSERLLHMGATITLIGSLLMTVVALAGESNATQLVCCMAIVCFGVGIVIPNTLSIALRDYGAVLGTAGAVFGCLYYVGITLLSSGMSLLHNGSVVVLPLYLALLATLLVLTTYPLVSRRIAEAAVV